MQSKIRHKGKITTGGRQKAAPRETQGCIFTVEETHLGKALGIKVAPAKSDDKGSKNDSPAATLYISSSSPVQTKRSTQTRSCCRQQIVGGSSLPRRRQKIFGERSSSTAKKSKPWLLVSSKKTSSYGAKRGLKKMARQKTSKKKKLVDESQTPSKTFNDKTLKGFCKALKSVVTNNPEWKRDESFRCVVEEFMGHSWLTPWTKHTSTHFIVHPGLEGTTDEIELDLETDYVDKKLYMVGYVETIGSDDYVMMDDAGLVYRTADTILYVVGKSLFTFLTKGSKDLGHYDYLRRLGGKTSLPCIGWTSHEGNEVEKRGVSKDTDGQSSSSDQLTDESNDTEFQLYKKECSRYARVLGRVKSDYTTK